MEPTEGNLFAGICNGPNAYYSPDKHEFTICPQMLQAPDSTLQMIIAHELGHSIDPCIASYALHEHSGTERKNPAADAMKAATEAFLKQKKAIPFKPNLPKQPDTMYSSFDSEMIEALYSRAYENHRSVKVLPGIPLSSNPFSSVIECLQGGSSVNARMGDLEGAKRNVLNNIKSLKASGADDSHPQIQALNETLGRLETIYSEKKACGYMGNDQGPSQMQEAFSDWLASEVIAHKVSLAQKAGDTEGAKRIAFEANGFFASLNCESFRLDVADEVKAVLSQAGCSRRGATLFQDLENMSRHEDSHPEGHARVSRIFMGHPTIADAIGCKQPLIFGAKRCE